MGILGLWIDGLTDEQRDRIIRGQKWRIGLLRDDEGRRCLIGHAAGVYKRENGRYGVEDPFYMKNGAAFRLNKQDHGVATHFDSLAQRFGLERIVRACKQRAAKGNTPDMTADVTAVDKSGVDKLVSV